MKIAIIVVLVLVLAVFSAMAIMGVYPLTVNLHKRVYQTKGAALSGTDVVALYEADKIVKGDAKLVYQFDGTKWYFSSPENLEKFRVNPQLFIPQFGGYCTFAVSKGFTAPSKANHRHRQDGKLYLFSNQSVLEDALKDFDNIKVSAQKKWQ